jgi:hypothetical protein
MVMRLQSRKHEPTEAERQAIYRSLQERNTLRQQQADTDSPNTAPSRQRIERYTYTWSDSSSQAELQWRAVFEELQTLHRQPPVTDFLLPSGDTVRIAKSILQWIKSRSAVATPEITPDGEGNLYLEWQSNNRRLSICLSNDPAGSYIYLSSGREYNALPLTFENLQITVSSYFA